MQIFIIKETSIFLVYMTSLNLLDKTKIIEIVSICSSNEISLIKMHNILSTIYGLMIDPNDDQLPVGLIAQQVEHCTGIAEARVRVPLRPEFLRPFFRYCSSSIT